MIGRIAAGPILVLAGLVGPAWAHHGHAPAAPAGAVGATVVPVALAGATLAALAAVALVMAIAALVCVGRARWRAGGIAVLVMLFAFEGALHSVHHLGEPAGQGRCAVESGSSNLSGVPAEPIDVGFCLVRSGAVALQAPAAPSRRVPRAERPRAPPSSA